MLSSFHGSTLNAFVGSTLFGRGLIEGYDCLISDTTNKLRWMSGQYTSTVKDSLVTQGPSAFGAGLEGVCFDAPDTVFVDEDSNDTSDNKLFKISGTFTSTLKTSAQIHTAVGSAQSVSWNGNHTPVLDGFGASKLYLLNGQFSSTVVTSLVPPGSILSASGVSYDGTNTPVSDAFDQLFLLSGVFTSTIKDSVVVGGAEGVSWDGADTPYAADEWLYLQSGQFTSTVKTSLDITAVTAAINDMDNVNRDTLF